jgi:hypothetical protein
MQKPSFAPVKTIAPILCALAMVACGPPEPGHASVGPIHGPFVVSDFFTPSGLMGDGQYPGRGSVGVNHNCRQPRPAGAQGDCYHFLYTPGDVHWAGSYWVYPSNNWGTVPGIDVIGPRDLGPDDMGHPLTGYTRVRFSAAVDALANPMQFTFFAGGINGDAAKPPQPYSDKGCLIYPADPSKPDSMRSVFCSLFSVTDSKDLAGDWTEYTLDLTQWGVSSVIGGFGWSLNDTANSNQQVSIYFDNIVWE